MRIPRSFNVNDYQNSRTLLELLVDKLRLGYYPHNGPSHEQMRIRIEKMFESGKEESDIFEYFSDYYPEGTTIQDARTCLALPTPEERLKVVNDAHAIWAQLVKNEKWRKSRHCYKRLIELGYGNFYTSSIISDAGPLYAVEVGVWVRNYLRSSFKSYYELEEKRDALLTILDRNKFSSDGEMELIQMFVVGIASMPLPERTNAKIFFSKIVPGIKIAMHHWVI